MQAAKASGSKSLTFGGGATAKLRAGDNIGGVKTTVLDSIYQTIIARLKRTQKGDFRAKFLFSYAILRGDLVLEDPRRFSTSLRKGSSWWILRAFGQSILGESRIPGWNHGCR
jgi:hypothetical protein